MYKAVSGKKLLIIGSDSGNVNIVNAAREMGVYTIVADGITDHSKALAKMAADEAWDIDYSDLETVTQKCKAVGVNGVFAGSIQNTGDDDCTGDYANKVYPLGKYQSEFTLGNGESCIRLVFPHSVKVCVEEIELVDATYVVPIRKQKTVLYYGDSITQGYDALHPSESYAVRLAEALDADVINKALGGAVFDPELVKIPCDKKADYVVVAYGTNDWNSVDLESLRKNAEGFLDGINSNYPGIPVFVTTPLWRPDWKATKKCGEFSNVENTIKEIFGHQENITVISGIDLIPHDENLFGDLYLHPSDKGFEHYTDSLKKYFTI